MKKILVPTDFSKRSHNAVDFAVQCATIISGNLTIVHAFELKGRGQIYKPFLDKIYTKLLKLKRSIEKKRELLLIQVSMKIQ